MGMNITAEAVEAAAKFLQDVTEGLRAVWDDITDGIGML